MNTSLFIAKDKERYPLDQDKIRGKWLLENAGCPEADTFLADWYREEMTVGAAGKMLARSGIKLFFLNLWEKIKRHV